MVIPFMNNYLLKTLPVYIVCGVYLGTNFIISHNFDGVRKYSISNKNRDYLTDQINTSSSVGGKLLGFFNGGLKVYILFYYYFCQILSEFDLHISK